VVLLLQISHNCKISNFRFWKKSESKNHQFQLFQKYQKKENFHERTCGHKGDFLKIAKKLTTATILIFWIFSPSLVKWLYISVGKLLIFST